MDFKNELNAAQYSIITQTEGPVMVLAGAGSGKTRVLTYRIAYLLLEKHVSPYNILAITFTNKATNEMRQRINALGQGFESVWVSTFHSLCARLLFTEAESIGYTSSFTIYDEVNSKKVIEDAITKLEFAKDIADNLKKCAKHHISTIKNFGYTVQQYGIDYALDYADELTRLFAEYEAQLKRNNAMDFDDLLLVTLDMLSTKPAILEKYQNKFRYVLVDEFQDTNSVQYQIVKLLSNKHTNLFVVGDEDQSIYGWRGANINNILGFKADFPNVQIFKLEQNYRSTTPILALANNLIAYNEKRIGKVLFTNKEGGDAVVARRMDGDREESEFVADVISRLVKYEGYKYSDIAVLVRLNALSRSFEQRFNNYGIPYRIIGGLKFYDRKEIKDLLAYLCFVNNPRDDVSLRRIMKYPSKGIGDATVERLFTYAQQNYISMWEAMQRLEQITELNSGARSKLAMLNHLLSELLEQRDEMTVLNFVNYTILKTGFKEAVMADDKKDNTDREENVGEFVAGVVEYEKDNPEALLTEYLQTVALYSDLDGDSGNDTVKVSTVHLAKGLEFKVVFLVALEEGSLPSARAIGEAAEMEEERRIAYVAVTRAMEKLYLTSCKTRYRFNRVESMQCSRFLKEMYNGVLPDELLDRRPPAERSGYGANNRPKYEHKREQPTGSTMSVTYTADVSSIKPAGDSLAMRLRDGMKVKHPKFGVGTVLQVYENKQTAAILFEGKGIMKLNIVIAPLTIIE